MGCDGLGWLSGFVRDKIKKNKGTLVEWAGNIRYSTLSNIKILQVSWKPNAIMLDGYSLGFVHMNNMCTHKCVKQTKQGL